MLIRAVTLCAVALLLLIGALALIDRFDDPAPDSQTQQSDGESPGRLNVVTWQGVTYREKSAVTTLLIVGVDKEGAVTLATPNQYRDGGQADFLLLMAIDHTRGQVHQLQIDRDTMTDVDILGVFGNEVGTRTLQICLAHSFGETPRDRARYTVRAVQNLMSGLGIDGYYIVDYASVPVLSDVLGGVTVTIPEDMTSVNSAWTEGSVVTLMGAEAETFVRTRKTVSTGSNRERMARQRVFMRSAIDRMSQLLTEDEGFADRLLSSFRDISVTNLSDQYLLEELDAARRYEILPVDTLDGEYTHDENGFVEFHMREDAAIQWVLEHLYERVG